MSYIRKTPGNDFETFNALSDENGPIFSANLASNFLALDKNKQGYRLTIGVSHQVGDLIAQNKLIGALYLADEKAFFAKKQELKNEIPDNKDQEDAK